MDRERLQEIARLSGGSYHEIYEAGAIPGDIKAFDQEIPISSESTPLWSSRWLLLLFVLALTLEWVTRKAFRLI